MSVGIIHFMAFPDAYKPGGSLVESLEILCRDDYFQTIQVTSIADAGLRRRAIELAHKSGKTVVFGAQPVLLAGKHDLNSLDPTVRQAAVDAVRAVIPQAVEWKAVALEVLSGPDPGAEKRLVAKAMFCASIKELLEISRRAGGPPILLEVFDRQPFGKNCLLGPTEEAAQVADKVCPLFREFGLVVDLSHLPLLGETPEQALKSAATDLRNVHIGNCVMRHKEHPAYGDNHPRFGVAEGENGAKELAGFLKALMDIGYVAEGKRRIVSFEIKPCGADTPADVIANAKETLEAAWKLL
jgi:sugar phosphate isomerase/epimerase